MKRFFLIVAAALMAASCTNEFKSFTFAHLTDTQIGFMDNSDRYALSDSLLTAAVTSVNALDPEFVVMTGDLVDKSDDELQNSLYEKGMAALRMPVYTVPGNHDFNKSWSEEILKKYNTLRGSEKFSFKKNGCAFIGIDSNCIKEGAVKAEQEQFEWLRNELKKARRCRYIFVFAHCPVMKKDIDEEEDYENFPSALRRKYVDLFHKYGVTAVMTGHTHKNYDINFEGIRFVAANPVCKPLGHGRSGFNVVHVNPDGIQIEMIPTILSSPE